MKINELEREHYKKPVRKRKRKLKDKVKRQAQAASRKVNR